ncbi:MAG: PilZ domain-containing protein [Gammaproteobacteria bacterium]
MEHRLYRRFPTNHPVEIHQGHQYVIHGYALNVSREGALLEADDGPMPGHGHVVLELKLSESDGAPRRLRGVVVHRDDRKLGVMFIDAWSQSDWLALTGCAGPAPLPAARH